MESFNNFNNLNIESEKKKSRQFAVLKKILKSALKKLTKKSQIKSDDSVRSEQDDNSFNEMLERRMEAQENLINEQIAGKREADTIGYCFVENDHGKFYWSSDANRFVAVDRDLIASTLCSTAHQQAQVQQCY